MEQIKTLHFPTEIHSAWRDYAAMVAEDPYSLHAYLAPKFATQLLTMLEDTSRSGKTEDQRTHAAWLLEEIQKQKEGKGHPALLVHNMPIDDLTGVPTPVLKGYFGTNNKGHLSEISQMVFTTACGMQPICHPQISGGNPFQHITPRLSAKNDRGNAGTVDFGPHTEGSFRTADEIPDKLSLLGLRNSSRVPTDVYPLDTLLHPRYLTKTDIRALYEDTFIFRSGDALSSGNELTHRGPSITSVDGVNYWRLRALEGTWEGTTRRSNNVVKKLIHILNSPSEYPELNASPILVPGTQLHLDNHRNAHGRPLIPDASGKPIDLETMTEEERFGVRWLERQQLRRARNRESGSAKL